MHPPLQSRIGPYFPYRIFIDVGLYICYIYSKSRFWGSTARHDERSSQLLASLATCFASGFRGWILRIRTGHSLEEGGCTRITRDNWRADSTSIRDWRRRRRGRGRRTPKKSKRSKRSTGGQNLNIALSRGTSRQLCGRPAVLLWFHAPNKHTSRPL